MHCSWCGKDRRRPSGYEQRSSKGIWKPLCVACRNERLKMAPPWSLDLSSILIEMRKIAP